MTADRRSLVEGLNPPSAEQRKAEQSFVYGEPREASNQSPAGATKTPTIKPTDAPDQPALLPQMYNRVPITTRARPELASALKRASLQRQLAGAEPFYVQDILEVALEKWLREHGHLE